MALIFTPHPTNAAYILFAARAKKCHSTYLYQCMINNNYNVEWMREFTLCYVLLIHSQHLQQRQPMRILYAKLCWQRATTTALQIFSNQTKSRSNARTSRTHTENRIKKKKKHTHSKTKTTINNNEIQEMNEDTPNNLHCEWELYIFGYLQTILSNFMNETRHIYFI